MIACVIAQFYLNAFATMRTGNIILKVWLGLDSISDKLIKCSFVDFNFCFRQV